MATKWRKNGDQNGDKMVKKDKKNGEKETIKW